MSEALNSEPFTVGSSNLAKCLRLPSETTGSRAAKSAQGGETDATVDIIDIRKDGVSTSLAPLIREGLLKPDASHQRSIPSLLLWDERGLKAYEKITYNPEYYLTNAEIGILEMHGREIACRIRPKSILLELGSGALRKTMILLRALDDRGERVDYYALDLDRNELLRTLSQIKPLKYVRCHGLLGTYDDGQVWLSKSVDARRPRCVLSLGSTTGGFTHPEACGFWYGWSKMLQQWKDEAQIIIGVDGCKDDTKVYRAYNDKCGANSKFIINALDHANGQLGYWAFDRHNWMVKGEWDKAGGRHTQYLVPTKDLEFEGAQLKRGEKILVVHSHKWDELERKRLWKESDLRENETFTINDCGYYGKLELLVIDGVLSNINLGIHILTPFSDAD